MNNTLKAVLLLLGVGLIVFLLYRYAFQPTPVPFCPQVGSTACITQQNLIEDELIIQLKPGITIDDITGPQGRKYRCFGSTIPGLNSDPKGMDDLINACLGDIPPDTLIQGRFQVESAANGPDRRIPDGCCDSVVEIITGAEAFRYELEHYLQIDNGNDLILDSVEITDNCNCDLNIIKVKLPSGVDINNGVAGGSSSAEDQNNGLIGRIGRNYVIIPKPVNENALDAIPIDTICSKQYYYDGTNNKAASLDAIKQAINAAGLTRCTILPTVDFGGETGSANGNTVVVAIVDTGVDPMYHYNPQENGLPGFLTDYNHTGEFLTDEGLFFMFPSDGDAIEGDMQEQNGNCIADDFFGYDFFNRDNNPTDRKGHGTHIAYTILTGDQNTNHDIRILPLQFGGYTDIANKNSFSCDLFAGICGINYAIADSVNIINLSWGYYASDTNSILREQLRLARENNILVVASAGNDGVDIDACQHWPSNFAAIFPENVIAVGALNDFSANPANYGKASYSNYGDNVTLLAPGTMIEGALVGSETGTVELSGTSMAAAVISRRAAMLWHPSAQASEVKALILDETVVRLGSCVKNNRVYMHQNDVTLLSAIGYE